VPVGVYVSAVMSGAGIGIDYLPLVLLAGGVGALVSSFTAGRLADRIGNRMAAIGASLVVVVTLVVLAALPLLPEVVRFPVLLGTFAISGYVGPGYAIVVGSELAHRAPTSVTVAISLNMSAFSIAVAMAAAAGGAVVDAWGASALALAGLVPVVGAMAVWLTSALRLPPAAPFARADHDIEGSPGEPL
jgi:predicted MFS family arabinose efflux permease